MFARRAAWDLSPSPLARAVEARRSAGLEILDLGETNPTRAGLREPAAALAAALADLARDPAAARYEPDPRGEPAARAAIAACHAGTDAAPAPEHVVLTAGTSEGYAHLFRLLADPGDRVHLPTPGYPLFEHLAGLEGLACQRYPLREPVAGARWRLDLEALRASLGPRSRAVLLIHPHNPTGAFVDPEDLAALRVLARERDLAIVSDEVFADTGFGGETPGALAGAGDGPLHFVLSGASKRLGLPQLKVAWIVVAGPAARRDEALARLEFVADAYLSVSPLAASMLPKLLAHRAAIAAELRARVLDNRARLAEALASVPGTGMLPAEAGWAAIVRIAAGSAATSDGEAPEEEALALALLEDAGVLVQPGFLFDLEPRDAAGRPCAHLVLGLLAEPERFAAGSDALARFLAERAPAAC